MTKALIFDFWGTLVENGVWSPVKQVKNILQIDLPFPEYVVRMEEAMMTQKFPELKDAFIKVCREFNLDLDMDKIERLVGLWNKSWMLAKPYPEVEEVLTELQAKYQLFLISNTDGFSIPQVLSKFKLDQYFEKMYLSYEQGLIKTNPKMLSKILKENNLNPEDCVVIGDSLESDIFPAKNAGIKTVLVDRKNTREYHPKVMSLTELKTILSW